jgi:hypothetical protein
MNFYAQAYAETGLSADEIWEEVICDSLGDMNIFAMDPEVNPFMSSMMSEVKVAATSTANEGSQNQTRGLPEGEAKGRASREIENYFSYNTLGVRVVSHIRQELQKLYFGIDDGIANGIAVEYGNKVYITDSGNENGILKFGVHKDTVYVIEDEQTRKEFIRRKNNDAVSKERVSDGLLARFGFQPTNRGTSDRRRPLGDELQTYIGKSEYNQEGISQENGNQRISRNSTEQRRDDGVSSLIDRLRAQLDAEVVRIK